MSASRARRPDPHVLVWPPGSSKRFGSVEARRARRQATSESLIPEASTMPDSLPPILIRLRSVTSRILNGLR